MAKVRRPQRPALSREYILDRALGLIDENGLEEFTFRKLAEKIGANPMAAYHYFPSKAALCDGIVETIYREVDPGAVGQAHNARSRVLAAARAMRAAFLRHPRALPLIGTRPAATKAMAPLIESFIAVLEEAGVPKARAVDAVACITTFVIGHALAQAGEPVGGNNAEGSDAFFEEANRFPRFAQAIAAAGTFDPDRQFEYGLKAVVDGILRS
jgi:TetR/AcrR family tetracycline transcriptional repressor